MSKLQHYYCFERLATKAKTRMDCTASTGGYEPFEDRRIKRATRGTDKRDANRLGGLTLRYSDTNNINANKKRKADRRISIGNDHLTSVYVPDIEKGFAFGDAKGTNDALLMLFHDFSTPNGVIGKGAKIEIFVARGQRNNCRTLCNLWSNGALEEEIEALRNAAKKEIDSTEND